MSADRAGTLGLTAADIAQALVDTPNDDQPANDPTVCPDCGSHDTELMRPWVAEYQCNDCGNLRRREA